MKFPRETFIHDADVEIVIPDVILDFNEKNIDDIINAQQRTRIFYDETLHIYSVTTLPPESNFENKDEATKFFKNLEFTLQATLIDTQNSSNLAVPSNYYSSQSIHRTPSSSSTTSSISGLLSSGASIMSRSSSDSTLSSTPGTPSSDYSIKKYAASKVIEGTTIYSAQYSSKKNNNNKMIVVERDDCWVCVLSLSFPVAHVQSRAQSQIALNVTVTQQQKKPKSSDPDLYSFDSFGVNLLEGLNDDPSFESLNPLYSTQLIDEPLRRSTSIYSSLPSTPIKRCSRKIISVKPTLNTRIRTTYVSPSEDTMMMSVELENDTENDIAFSLDAVKVNVANGFVTKYAWGPQDTSNDEFPIVLRPFDQVTFLYNVTVFEDPSFPSLSDTQHYPIPDSKASSRRGSIVSTTSTLVPPVENKHRPLSVTVIGCPVVNGIKSRCIESKWNCMLDVSNLLMKDDDSVVTSQLEEVNNKYAPMMYDGGINTTTETHDSNTVKNYNSLHNNEYGYENNSSDVNKQYNGYIPDINLSDVDSVDGGDNGILPNGRLPKAQKQMNLDSDDGVLASFSVDEKPVVGKAFTMKAFIVNNSNHVRKFTLTIPKKKRFDEKSLYDHRHGRHLSQASDITLVEANNNYNKNNIIQPLGNPFVNESEFLRKHLEFETPNADFICLDNDVKIGPIYPNKSEYVTLHFISTKEAVQTIELMQLVDEDTGSITNLRNAIQVYVGPSNTKKGERKIDHNLVLKQVEAKKEAKKERRINYNPIVLKYFEAAKERIFDYNPIALKHIEAAC